ncbi:uncharacterized protein LOC120346350 [Styela clava]
MAKQFLYACAVLSSILLVSVSASVLPIPVGSAYVEAGRPEDAKVYVDYQIKSFESSASAEINTYLADNPTAYGQRIFAHYMLNELREISKDTTANSIQREINNMPSDRQPNWQAFKAQTGL